MTAALAQRQLALAAVALLGAVVALAVGSTRAEGSERRGLPEAVPAPGGGWYSSFAAVQRPGSRGRRTACGHVVGPRTLGVTHSVLPCDVKLYLSYNGTEVLTQVIGRGPYVPGRDFEVTEALADLLGLRGTQPVRWRYAR